jgi:hypothetical protein
MLANGRRRPATDHLLHQTVIKVVTNVSFKNLPLMPPGQYEDSALSLSFHDPREKVMEAY